MIAGGLVVTILGLYMLSGDSHSLIDGFKVMLECNKADSGIYAQAAVEHAQHIVQQDHYNRLSVIQPVSHETLPWPSLFYGFLATGLWYSVLNQFMIQRVLAAKNMYHARMGIVLAGYMKILMPLFVVVPGLILFARYPEVMFQPWERVRDEADKGYIVMLQTIVPIGLRGLFLAALFGAIQSTVNSVLNSTATIVTLDIYKRMFHKEATEKHFVKVGVWTSVVILFIAIIMGGFIKYFKGGLFEYIQTLYAFFAPPFSAIFLLGILFRRINGIGASVTVVVGFLFGLLMKTYLSYFPELFGDAVYKFVKPYSNQSLIHWLFCVIICVFVSLATAPPRAEQVTDQLTFNWRKLNIFDQLGTKWYTSVIFWWGLFAAIIVALVIIFSGQTV